MPRPAPTFEPVDPEPPAATPEALCERGACRIAEAALWLGMSVRFVESLVADEELPTLKIGTRRLIPRVALVNYLAARLKESQP